MHKVTSQSRSELTFPGLAGKAYSATVFTNQPGSGVSLAPWVQGHSVLFQGSVLVGALEQKG